jgi:gamma-glutamylcyclotransferase (GGCT)/AIG2-like uncharacterized protein YtfP
MATLTTLFVYGTLKRGCCNHSVMRGAEFVGEAATEPAYLLVNCGSYPGLVRAQKGQAGIAIQGELYRVDGSLLAILDRFEDVPCEYVRETIDLADGAQAQTYIYRRDVSGLKDCGLAWTE